jgi:aldose 1-epimerase
VTVRKERFGETKDGRSIERFHIANDSGMSVELMSYGATLLSVRAKDREGRPDELTLGFDSLEGYLGDHPFFGSTVGRVANRIAGASFSIGPKRVQLEKNEGRHHLHGGSEGFHRQVWKAELLADDSRGGVRFSRTSAHGEGGYPGTLEVRVTYSLNARNELRIEYEAETDKPTPVNLTNHAYWNLDGAGSGKILDHRLKMWCSQYLPVDAEQIPTGAFLAVDGSAMDFTRGKIIRQDMKKVPGGYDHCFVADGEAGTLRRVARLVGAKSERVMEVESTLPGIQLYTGNKLNGIPGRHGQIYKKHDALCLETQHFPDAVNQSAFPSVILRPRETYSQQTVYRFLVR